MAVARVIVEAMEREKARAREQRDRDPDIRPPEAYFSFKRIHKSCDK
jgi:hypothetical protein